MNIMEILSVTNMIEEYAVFQEDIPFVRLNMFMKNLGFEINAKGKSMQKIKEDKVIYFVKDNYNIEVVFDIIKDKSDFDFVVRINEIQGNDIEYSK